jgi:hypothetical protein
MQRRCKHTFPTIDKLCFLRGPCKVVIKNGVEFRDVSLQGQEPGIELSYQLQNNGKKGIRLCKEDFMCYLK